MRPISILFQQKIYFCIGIENFSDLVLMLLTDSGAPMIKLGTIVRAHGFNKLIHVLCTAHALHNVAGTIRKQYPHVDKIIMNVKKNFRHSHTRVSILRSIAKDVKIPPAPSPTRWGKWIDSVDYYANDLSRRKLIRGLQKILAYEFNDETNNEEDEDDFDQFEETGAIGGIAFDEEEEDIDDYFEAEGIDAYGGFGIDEEEADNQEDDDDSEVVEQVCD